MYVAEVSQHTILGAYHSGAVSGAIWYAVSNGTGMLFRALLSVVASIVSGAVWAPPRGRIWIV